MASSEDAKKWKHRLRKKRERTAEVLAELKRVRHDVHAERRALADAAETIKLETISKAAAHRRAAEEHRADLERLKLRKSSSSPPSHASGASPACTASAISSA